MRGSLWAHMTLPCMGVGPVDALLQRVVCNMLAGRNPYTPFPHIACSCVLLQHDERAGLLMH